MGIGEVSGSVPNGYNPELHQEEKEVICEESRSTVSSVEKSSENWFEKATNTKKLWKESGRKDDRLFIQAFYYYSEAIKEDRSLPENNRSLPLIYKFAKMQWISRHYWKSSEAIQQNRQKAIRWCKLAVNNYPKAIYLLATILSDSSESPQADRLRLNDSIKWLNHLVATQHIKGSKLETKAYFKLGRVYCQKKDLETNPSIKILHYQNAIDNFNKALNLGHTEALAQITALKNAKKVFERTEVEKILTREISLDPWNKIVSEEENLDFIISNYVMRFMHPFIHLKMTKDNEIANRPSMMDRLLSAFQKAGYRTNEESIEQIALKAYFVESVRCKYIHINNHYYLRRVDHSFPTQSSYEVNYGTKDYWDIIRGLKAALSKDFHSAFLEKEGMHDLRILTDRLNSAMEILEKECKMSKKDAFNLHSRRYRPGLAPSRSGKMQDFVSK